jgi:acetolactate synthase-1/2/3 large subunit
MKPGDSDGTRAVEGTAADLIHETLKAHGVTHFFGIEEPVHLVHAFAEGGIRQITVHDEKHADIMAHGHAKATGRPGACGAMQGPGATNLITGLLEARNSSTPIVAFVQDIARERHGRNAASELDHHAALGPL